MGNGTGNGIEMTTGGGVRRQVVCVGKWGWIISCAPTSSHLHVGKRLAPLAILPQFDTVNEAANVTSNLFSLGIYTYIILLREMDG